VADLSLLRPLRSLWLSRSRLVFAAVALRARLKYTIGNQLTLREAL